MKEISKKEGFFISQKENGTQNIFVELELDLGFFLSRKRKF